MIMIIMKNKAKTRKNRKTNETKQQQHKYAMNMITRIIIIINKKTTCMPVINEWMNDDYLQITGNIYYRKCFEFHK